jgi:ribonucleotide monophosphatase NagD (HAD superfamily)
MPDQRLRFKPLGKPETLLFEMGLKLAGCSTSDAIMIGDQLTTDILGANRAGIASALIGGGITPLPLPKDLAPELTPTFVMTGLSV